MNYKIICYFIFQIIYLLFYTSYTFSDQISQYEVNLYIEKFNPKIPRSNLAYYKNEINKYKNINTFETLIFALKNLKVKNEYNYVVTYLYFKNKLIDSLFEMLIENKINNRSNIDLLNSQYINFNLSIRNLLIKFYKKDLSRNRISKFDFLVGDQKFFEECFAIDACNVIDQLNYENINYYTCIESILDSKYSSLNSVNIINMSLHIKMLSFIAFTKLYEKLNCIPDDKKLIIRELQIIIPSDDFLIHKVNPYAAWKQYQTFVRCNQKLR